MNKLISRIKKMPVVYLAYGALALVILLPLLGSGYVFAADMVFTPHLRWPEPFVATGAFLYFLNLFLPSPIIQKILLFAIIFFSGVGMHKLIPSKSELAKYFAGIFYVLNPFVYSRFLYGHFWLLAAYALMPFAVKSIFNFFGEINLKNALKLSFWLALIGFISAHSIVFAFLFFAIAFLAYFFKIVREKKDIFRMFKYVFLILAAFFVLSSGWIAPYFNKQFPQGQALQEILNRDDFDAFKTVSDANYGILINAAALYGFWGEKSGQYVVPKDTVPYWFLLFLIFAFLIIRGAADEFKKNKIRAGIFTAVALTAFLFSAGVAYQPFVPAINFLNDKFFIFRGFRDSQKFSALLALCWAFWGALGVEAVLNNFKIKKSKNLKRFLAAFFIALPILYTPLMVWGFKGQLFLSQYPQSWIEINEFLNHDYGEFKTLFLPWHQYLSLSFVKNRVIANPAPRFFDKEVIAGDNMEIGKIYTHSQRPVSRLVEQDILAKKDQLENAGELLAPYGIKYVILAKEADWQEYNFLNRQKDLEFVKDSGGLIIYKNEKWQE